MEALILDLRSNPGGLMSSALEVADRFLDQGIIVSTRGANTAPQKQIAHSPNTYPRFPLVVLIDQGSASGSEIVAGALQDHNRGVIVGNRSWGKGSVQRPIRLPDSGAVLKLTTDYYYLPNGRCVHRRDGADLWGVDPDVEEAFEPESMEKFRALQEQLIEPSTAERPAPTPDKAADRDLLNRLLALDTQLDQAVKQCKGLIRAKPALKSLAETFSEIKKIPIRPAS